MEKKYDVISLGELLIDFTTNGISAQGNPLLEANPGGAPCNVLAILTKLGKSTAFIGKVGNDHFGRMLKKVLEESKIETEGLILDNNFPTTLAFVHTAPNGDRDFSFYRKPGADMMLNENEVSEDLVCNTRVFHFGTLSMTDEGVRAATKKAIALAKNAGAVISFDPNLRPPLWNSLDLAREQISYGLSKCDMVKLSEEELLFVTGCKDIRKGAMLLKEQYNIRLLNVTAGAHGSYSYYDSLEVYQPGFQLGGTIETTGAGDTFCGSVINYVLEHGLETLNKEHLNQMLRFSNAAAYLVTTKKGALRSMPEKEQILELCHRSNQS